MHLGAKLATKLLRGGREDRKLSALFLNLKADVLIS